MAQNLITRQVYASEARTATPTAPVLLNTRNAGVQVFINITASAATPSVVFRIQGKDGTSGKWYTLLESSAQTGTGQLLLQVEPALVTVANKAVGGQIPRVWRVTATHADADSITYSVGANLLI